MGCAAVSVAAASGGQRPAQSAHLSATRVAARPKAPILPPAELVGRNVRLCLMTVRAEVEELVVGKNAAYLARGGVLASVFPDSKYALGKAGPAAGKAA